MRRSTTSARPATTTTPHPTPEPPSTPPPSTCSYAGTTTSCRNLSSTPPVIAYTDQKVNLFPTGNYFVPSGTLFKQAFNNGDNRLPASASAPSGPGSASAFSPTSPDPATASSPTTSPGPAATTSSRPAASTSGTSPRQRLRLLAGQLQLLRRPHRRYRRRLPPRPARHLLPVQRPALRRLP